jgi:hypothetical protein
MWITGEITTGEKLSLYRFVNQKSHKAWGGTEDGPSHWEACEYTTEPWHEPSGSGLSVFLRNTLLCNFKFTQTEKK